MLSLLLSVLILAQTVQADNATVSGILKTSAGDPAVGVRVAVMAIPESAQNAITGAALVSLAATDETGRYRLENIPPGRYYIAAGRIDFPTYFPGALDMPQGTIVAVAAKANIGGLNFALQDSSIRIATSDNFTQSALTIPVLVRVEGGAPQPVSADGKFLTILLVRTADNQRYETPLDSPTGETSIPAATVGAEYRIAINNIPSGYILKSLSYGATNLRADPLKLNAANFLQLSAASTSPQRLTIDLNTGMAIMLQRSTSSIAITLETVPTPAPHSGVRVRGQAPVRGSWSVDLDSTPGIFYADGSFELQGVSPGRHIVVLQDNSSVPHFYGAVVTVGDQDLDGVTVDSAAFLPSTPTVLPSNAASGPATPGSVQKLAGLFGRALEEDGKTPIAGGSLTVLGPTLATIPIGKDGAFTIAHLLPGSYDLRVEAFEHFTLYQTVHIDDLDVHIDLTVRSAKADPPAEH